MKISDMLDGAEKVAIFGHVRPDGDCVGSAMGLYNYILEYYPQIKADVYLEPFAETFNFLAHIEDVKDAYEEGIYDTVFVLDASSCDRVGANGLACILQAGRSFNIDHHISNPGDICKYSIIKPDVSSTSEVIYYLLEPERVTKPIAEGLYLGIVHDTGVFKYSCTGRKTLEAVGALIGAGVDFPRIIHETYYSRGITQTRVTGYVLQNCKLAPNNQVIYGTLTPEEMERFGATHMDVDGIIDTLRTVRGTEVAIFLYPVADGYKISMRSRYYVDVARICQLFGGGGHARAAGCSIDKTPEEIIKLLLCEVEKNL